jgi:hypothetical protein
MELIHSLLCSYPGVLDIKEKTGRIQSCRRVLATESPDGDHGSQIKKNAIQKEGCQENTDNIPELF